MILTSKVLKSVPGVAYGHLTLEAMQNWRMPKIDLFVREVIQNCSDAADPIKGRDYFCVSINTQEFDGSRFIETLSGFDEKTQRMFSNPQSRYIEIRDTETTGLTGPLVITDENEKDHGNYFRLVFDTGKAQTQKYSGGNWGYGKSAYYGIGAGFVIYYSQIEESGAYKSRLIVTLIENEESESAILRGHKDGSNSAGKAWWGKELHGTGMDSTILPLQDNDEIETFLSIFGIKPFKNGQTGTSVIIPYVNYAELMGNMITDEMRVDSDIKNRCDWTFPDLEGFKKYLKLAIQRWYAPALNNTDLPKLVGKKWLYATVNEDLLNYDSMYPFFQLVQRLYTSALAKTVSAAETGTSWNGYYEKTLFPISIKNYIDNRGNGNTEVGYLSVARIPKSVVDCDSESNLNPFLLLGLYEESGSNQPIVMFARRLGMVIDYSYRNEWVHGVPSPDDSNEYVFAFFVPYLGEKKRLKPDLSVKKYAGKTLEEYLISCEASDHDGWEDHDKMSVVSYIQGRVVERLKTLIKGEVIPPSGSYADRLGSVLSRLIGITKTKLGKDTSSGNSNNSGGSSTSRNLKLSLTVQEFDGLNQVLSLKLECKKGLRKAVICPQVNSDGGSLRSISWERDIGTTFPVCFTKLKTRCSTDSEEMEAVLTEDKPTEYMSTIKISLCHEQGKTKNGDIVFSKKITQIVFEAEKNLDENLSIEGLVYVNTSGNEYEYDLVASEEER